MSNSAHLKREPTGLQNLPAPLNILLEISLLNEILIERAQRISSGRSELVRLWSI